MYMFVTLDKFLSLLDILVFIRFFFLGLVLCFYFFYMLLI